MIRNIEVINTAVVPLVGVVCFRKQEVSRVIDSCQGVGVCCVGSSEGEVEGTSRVLWLDGARDGEVGTLHHLLRIPVDGGEYCDVWIQYICKKTEVIGIIYTTS